jgi:hypothetical protein
MIFGKLFTNPEGDLELMIGGQTTGQRAQPKSMIEYAADLARSGIPVLPGQSGTFWTKHESGAMLRRPIFHLGPPPSREVRQVLWRGRSAIASYLLEPDERHPANAWLYLCTDQTYALDKLAPPVRRNIGRGLKELRIAFVTSEQLLAHGTQAFYDTRRRNGLSDGTPEEFRQWLIALARMPEVVFLGAWKDNDLAAFLTITEVNDWAELGCYSVDALLSYRPNDTLIYIVLSHYLVERRYCLVSFGLSSIQAESNAAGLHKFKTKLGFEARPVHRAFVPHPLLRPFINRLILRAVNTILRLKPGERRLKKVGGVLACILGDAYIT